MTHNEIACFLVKAMVQEERRTSRVYMEFLHEDFYDWDNGRGPTQRLISALRNCVCDNSYDVGRLTKATTILEDEFRALT